MYALKMLGVDVQLVASTLLLESQSDQVEAVQCHPKLPQFVVSGKSRTSIRFMHDY
jgi:hypothetical protein